MDAGPDTLGHEDGAVGVGVGELAGHGMTGVAKREMRRVWAMVWMKGAADGGVPVVRGGVCNLVE